MEGIYDGWKVANFFKTVEEMLSVRAQTEMTVEVLGDTIGTPEMQKKCTELKRKKEKNCAGACKRVRARADYSLARWVRREGQAHCQECAKGGRPKIAGKKCGGACKRVRARVDYSTRQWDRREGQAICTACAGVYVV